MVSSDIMRGQNDIIILSILIKGDSYGYEISKEINSVSEGQYPIKETTLYSAFNRLEKSGWISSYYGSETLGKRRTYYKITDIGLAYCHSKCLEWLVIKNIVDNFIKRSGL